MVGAAPDSGRFEGGAFPAVLRGFVRAAADGRLDVDAASGRARLWLESGQVRAVVSDAESEKLGSWLVARRVMDAEQMAILLLRQPEGVRYGSFLVTEGVLDAERLERELEAQAVAIVARLLFTEGEFSLDRSDRLPNDAATIEMTTASLLVAAVRATSEVQALMNLAPSDHFPASTEDALLQLQHVQLSPGEGYLLSRVDGAGSVATLQRLVPLPREQFVRSLVALLAAGLVELRERPVARPQPASELAERARPAPVAAKPAPEELAYSALERKEHEEVLRLATVIGQQDYYLRLGLTRLAGADQIGTRYRELVRTYHPDRARERHLRSLQAELGSIYRALQEAFETLSVVDARKRYDQAQTSAAQQSRGYLSNEAQEEETRRNLVRTNIGQARRLMSQNDFGPAAELLDQAVRLMPDPETLLLLAQVEFRNPMWAQRALDRLRHAVSLNPKFTKGWLELANYWGMRGQADRQKQCLEKVLSYDPANKDARAALNAIIEAQPKRRFF